MLYRQASLLYAFPLIQLIPTKKSQVSQGHSDPGGPSLRRPWFSDVQNLRVEEWSFPQRHDLLLQGPIVHP